jgi:hypothetical protein
MDSVAIRKNVGTRRAADGRVSKDALADWVRRHAAKQK